MTRTIKEKLIDAFETVHWHVFMKRPSEMCGKRVLHNLTTRRTN